MGLHEALITDVVWVWRWYSAYVQREGRAHMMRVPIVKRENVTAPSWYYNQDEIDRYIERERRAGDLYYYPGYFYDGAGIRRACNRPQHVTYWRDLHNIHWREYIQAGQRGVCQACYQFAMTTTDTTSEQSELRQRQHDHGIAQGTTEGVAQWILTARNLQL